jgi:hypothetical protein
VAGANLNYNVPQRALTKIMRVLGIYGVVTNVKRGAGAIAPGDVATTFPRQIAICEKPGVPATNTAADEPTGIGDLCYDSSNNKVYRCTVYTSGTVFTWAKIAEHASPSNSPLGTTGANLFYNNRDRVLTKILRKMGLTNVAELQSRRIDLSADADEPRKVGICYKAGAPANDTAEDQPTGAGDLCYDSTGNDVYRCDQMSDESTFTWTKIVD